jgi:hypothetical protein
MTACRKQAPIETEGKKPRISGAEDETYSNWKKEEKSVDLRWSNSVTLERRA